MKVYVDELPKSCDECPMCRSGGVKINKNGRYIDAQGCVFGQYMKYRRIDDEIDNCPLQTLQSVQNEKAVECLKKVKAIIANHTQELWTCENDDIDTVLYDDIDQLIAELKGEKNEL